MRVISGLHGDDGGNTWSFLPMHQNHLGCSYEYGKIYTIDPICMNNLGWDKERLNFEGRIVEGS